MIRGFIDGGQAWVFATVEMHALPGQVEGIAFLLDTGSMRSLLAPPDAIRLGIDPAALFPDPRTIRASGFGGNVSLLVTSASFLFDDDDDQTGQPQPVPIGILEPAPSTMRLPSVLGMDFLQHFRLTISVRDAQVELDPRS